MTKSLNVPLTQQEKEELKNGDFVYLTGTIYTARDAAHKRMFECIERGVELPIDIKGQFIYYMGPSPAREGRPSDPQDLPHPAEWISILPSFLNWDLAE